MKNISILGSTGSIGKQTLDVVREHKDRFRIVGLSTNTNIELLRKQIKEFKPVAVCVGDNAKAEELGLLPNEIEVFLGMEGIGRIASLDEADTVVNSLVGSVGILPTIEAIRHNKDIAMANKETLVTAGSIVMKEAKKYGVKFIPIDSEHNAMLQCLKGERIEDIRRIVITCSGGPFRNLSNEELQNVKVKDALNHPTWSMGAKITVDCATLMNKGFEVIETHWLYGIPYERIEVVIHPESIIHSMVEFSDRSVIAQMSLPDMKLPIQYALSYPDRIENGFSSLDFARLKGLTFDMPDTERFSCLRIAYGAGIKGGTLPAVLNAANEVAVRYFLENKITFPDIPRIVQSAIEKHNPIKNPELDEILEIDRKTMKDVEKDILIMKIR